MKKLSLSDFEYHISSTTRTAGQAYVSEGKVNGLRELEKHFWVSTVQDTESAYETEVIISPGRINAFACECWSEPRKFMCAHIAASLLQLRKFLDQSTAEKARKMREKAEAQPELARLSIHKLLPEVPSTHLIEFIRDYARRDRDFALALKTRFADTIDGKGNPYKALLASVLPKHKNLLKEADFKRIAKLRNDLDDRMDAARHEGNLSLMFKIASAALLLLGPLSKVQSESVRTRLSDICNNYTEICFWVYRTDTASPELRDEVWGMFLELVTKEQLPDMLHRDVSLFMSDIAAQEKQRLESIKKAFLAANTAESKHLCQLYLMALAQSGKEVQALKVFKEVYYQSSKITDFSTEARNALLELYYTKAWSTTALILDDVLGKHQLTQIRKAEFEKLRFHIAEAMGDIPAQLTYLRQLFVQFGRLETFEQIRELSGSNWADEYNALLQYTKDNGNLVRIAQLLDYQGEQEVLALWLKAQPDIGLTIDFAACLTDEDLIQIMVAHISSHLEVHFGRPGSEFARECLAKLLRQKRFSPVKKIIAAVSKAFPERAGLQDTMQEIYDFKPKVGGFF